VTAEDVILFILPPDDEHGFCFFQGGTFLSSLQTLLLSRCVSRGAIETPIPLDGINMDLLFAGPRQDFKAFEHATSQTGEFAHNDAISRVAIL
jgi:hypothetical protein